MYLLPSKGKICITESSKRSLKSILRRRPRWRKGVERRVSAKTYLQHLLALGLCLALFWLHMRMSAEKTPLDGKKVPWAADRSLGGRGRVSVPCVENGVAEIRSRETDFQKLYSCL